MQSTPHQLRSIFPNIDYIFLLHCIYFLLFSFFYTLSTSLPLILPITFPTLTFRDSCKILILTFSCLCSLTISVPGWPEAPEEGCVFILQSLSSLSIFGLRWDQRSGQNYSGDGLSYSPFPDFQRGNFNYFLTTLNSLHSQAFELLCDLLLLYRPSLPHTTPALQTLVYLPSDSLRCDMAGFLIDYIFSDADCSDLNG